MTPIFRKIRVPDVFSRVAAVAGRWVRTVKSWVMIGPPAGCILDAARKADAIVMGTLGRTGLPHLLLGSVAERIVRRAPVPVLTVGATARRKRPPETLTGRSGPGYGSCTSAEQRAGARRDGRGLDFGSLARAATE